MSEKLTIAAVILFICSALALFGGRAQLDATDGFDSPSMTMSWEFGPGQGFAPDCFTLCDLDCNCELCCLTPNGYQCSPAPPLPDCDFN